MHCRLLQAAIGGFSTFFPDYKERIARHEAAHFLGSNRTLNLVHSFMILIDNNYDPQKNSWVATGAAHTRILVRHRERARQSH